MQQETINFIGYVAATCTTVFLLPQLIRVVRLRSSAEPTDAAIVSSDSDEACGGQQRRLACAGLTERRVSAACPLRILARHNCQVRS
jgi:hypothetical protein